MTSLPSLTGKELLSTLKKAGFVLLHAGEIIGPGLFAKILRDCDLSREQFQKLL